MTTVGTDAPWRDFVAPEFSPILAAALEVFLKRGYHGATVREIASRAGLTVPALYYHHDSKEGLLRDLLKASLEPIAANVVIAAQTGEAAPERLANVVECLVLAFTRSSASAAIDAAESRYLGPAAHREYVSVRDQVERQLQEVLCQGLQEGHFQIDDVTEARRAILGMTQTIPRWYDPTGAATPDEIAYRYVRMVLRLVGHRVPECS